MERLGLERLAAAHADVERLRAQVEPPPALPGLVDYRAIFHAHAGDSAHTGGSREEILADALRAGVDVIFLSDHYRAPKDFMDGWRGLRSGVLFIPGSEAHGFLIHPDSSVVPYMQGEAAALIAAIKAGAGMAFLSHIEERADHPLDGLTGMEIYNRHADAKDDVASMRALVAWMTDPDQAAELRDGLGRFPEEAFAAQLDYPALYLEKWDRETLRGPVVGVAANDCHHNQVFVVKQVSATSVRVGTAVDNDDEMMVLGSDTRPRLAELTRGHAPGDVLGRYDFDPYWVSMRSSSTHVLAAQLDEASIRAAVAAGHVYVAHDWMADPTGFSFFLEEETGRSRRLGLPQPAAVMGDDWFPPARPGAGLVARFPLECRIRLLRDGEEIAVTEASAMEHPLARGGVYRVEGWLEVDGEWRIWIYSNPIYVARQNA